ncbi:NAD(P)H-binding protein [Nocardia sp. NBC_00511]|uniref:NmrA family NAD(P)-binding protein n=1 Tax=Nocardia sp. NBC_00511 TaxID=2903591 RepID=UPI0030E01339
MFLLTGGTGTAGSIILREFVRQQVPIRALVRDPAKAERLAAAAPDVDVVVGDMLRAETLGPALDGVDRVLMISSPRDRMVETQCRFIDAAKGAGVRHIVKLSGKESGTTFDQNAFRGTRWHQQIERYLEASGVEWTQLRPSQFMQTYLPEALTGVDVARHALVMPIGASALSPVDIEDVARVSVAMMRDADIAGQVFEMTGPEALTQSEVAELLSAATGTAFTYESVTRQHKRAAHAATGLPDTAVDLLDELYAGRAGSPRSRVDLSTHERYGVAPTTFAEFARRNASAFAG